MAGQLQLVPRAYLISYHKSYFTHLDKQLATREYAGTYQSYGFLRADVAPMTMARARPRPAPREAPTVAADREDLPWESRPVSIDKAPSRANSTASLSFASSCDLIQMKQCSKKKLQVSKVKQEMRLMGHDPDAKSITRKKSKREQQSIKVIFIELPKWWNVHRIPGSLTCVHNFHLYYALDH